MLGNIKLLQLHKTEILLGALVSATFPNAKVIAEDAPL
jgi:hypothetical protein